MAAYKRILLKLSGEALMGDDAYGINRATIVRIVREVQEVTQLGCEVAVVIGGGNIFRGVAGGSVGMDRATADYMGMLATVMNALALADTMRQEGITARVMSAIGIEQVVEPYVRPKALTTADVAESLIAAERSVATLRAAEDAEKAKAEGKPVQSPEIVTRRIEGSVAKFLKEVSLHNQAFVKNEKQSVEQMLKEKATQVHAFTLYVVGEGIEKRTDDFAAEVAAQVAAAKGA